jgi:hypothetical protein
MIFIVFDGTDNEPLIFKDSYTTYAVVNVIKAPTSSTLLQEDISFENQEQNEGDNISFQEDTSAFKQSFLDLRMFEQFLEFQQSDTDSDLPLTNE